MSFMEAYKHLDNLCKTFPDYPKGVSSYIEAMESHLDISFQCDSWKADYAALKKYRYIRNQISHENYASEENMCEPSDELWLTDFHTQMLNQTDPLGLYYKRKRAAQQRNPQPVGTNYTTRPAQQMSAKPKATQRQPVGCATFIVLVLFIIAMVVLIALNI